MLTAEVTRVTLPHPEFCPLHIWTLPVRKCPALLHIAREAGAQQHARADAELCRSRFQRKIKYRASRDQLRCAKKIEKTSTRAACKLSNTVRQPVPPMRIVNGLQVAQPAGLHQRD